MIADPLTVAAAAKSRCRAPDGNYRSRSYNRVRHGGMFASSKSGSRVAVIFRTASLVRARYHRTQVSYANSIFM